jgi:4-hydroxybenzoate polyprenyltransferase
VILRGAPPVSRGARRRARAAGGDAGPAAGIPRLLGALVVSLRPRQWTKNLLVFAGLIFSQSVDEPGQVARAVLAFLLFCLLSGSVYLVNDVFDADRDRMHPQKRRRPVASGRLPARVALIAGFALLVATCGAAFLLSARLGSVAVAYAGLLTVYSAGLKHVVIVDALMIATGFVLRAMAGVVALEVEFSHWLLLCTILLALFLTLGKRRHELLALDDGAADHRPILTEYSPQLLDQMIAVVTASTLMAYALYTMAPETQAKLGTARLPFTIPFVLYGIFRYLYLLYRHDLGGNPSEHLLTDRALMLDVALWAAVVVVILYLVP